MAKYYVGIPVTMEVGVEVEADSEEEAIEKGFSVEWSLSAKGCDIVNSESHLRVTSGNCCSAVLNSAYAQLCYEQPKIQHRG